LQNPHLLSSFKQFQDLEKFMIPVADNVAGMGKAMLVINYTRGVVKCGLRRRTEAYSRKN
jgi:hypothetical protein